ncbi:MAG: flagellin lysine-N-methylase [Peptostreptococcaceae bacterium]|nr:flagellin lysine-N-methylase [Peptostreptococcaceae bacterium]
MKFLVPKFYNDFNCIGSKCEDTCCQIWNVYVDKKVYNKCKEYKKDVKLKEKFKENIKRNRSNNTDFDYAKIIMNENRMCPFLDENKLCSVYLKCGEDYMGTVCKIYPRTYGNTELFKEKGLSTSCPEVVRLSLFNKEKMEFEVVDMDDNDFIDKYDYRLISKQEQELFWVLRNFSIELIQNREYDLSERLTILAIVMKKIDELLKSKKYDEILNSIDLYKKLIENFEFKATIEDININKEVELYLINELLKLGYKKNGDNYNYSEIYKTSIETFEFFTGNNNIILNSYIDAYENYYKPFIKNKSYILENYLVNNMFNTKFPYSEFFLTDIFNNMIVLVIRYIILKFNLIAATKKYKEDLTDEKIVEIIYKLSRFMEHGDIIMEAIINIMERRNMKDLAHIVSMVLD